MFAGGCTANDQSLVDAEAHEIVSVGMRLKDAERALNRVGFACGSAQFNTLACERSRPYAMIATCVQRVSLGHQPNGLTVTVMTIPPPACGSF